MGVVLLRAALTLALLLGSLAARGAGLDAWLVLGCAALPPIWYYVPLGIPRRALVWVVGAMVGLAVLWLAGPWPGAMAGLVLSMALLNRLGSWHLARAAQ